MMSIRIGTTICWLMFTSVHKRQFFYTSQRHRNDIAKQQQQTAAATSSTEIRLSYVVINIIINEMKTKAAFKAANEHLLAATTLVVINTIYLCIAT